MLLISNDFSVNLVPSQPWTNIQLVINHSTVGQRFKTTTIYFVTDIHKYSAAQSFSECFENVCKFNPSWMAGSLKSLSNS